MKFPSCLLMKNNDFMHRLNWKTSFLTLFTGVLLAQQDVLATTNILSLDLLPSFENREFIRCIDSTAKKSTIVYLALNGEKDSSKKAKSILGDPLVSDSKFVMKLKQTCSTSLDKCIYDQITVDYFSLFQKLTQEKQYTLLKDGSLEVKLVKIKSENEDQKVEVFLSTYLNGVKTDSILIYNYLNIPENSVANEMIYYIDETLRIWQLSVTYEENSISVDSWERFVIDQKTGHINKDTNF